jgi:hypothetical protein
MGIKLSAAWLLFLSWSCLSSTAFAQDTVTEIFPTNPTQVFAAFNSELIRQRLNAPMIVTGVLGLNDVQFQNLDNGGSATALYYPSNHRMVLNQHLFDSSTGRLKPIVQIGYGDVGVLVHELWHSFYWSHERNSGSDFIQVFNRNFTRLYGSYPANKREEIHEEAYGLFIQDVTRSYLFFQNLMTSYSSAQRKAMRENLKIRANYENGFKFSFKGYYRDVWGNVTFSAIAMSDEDKKQVLIYLLNNQIKGSFDLDFSKEIYP